MPYITGKDNVQLYYETFGTGEPLVFIHGLGASSSMFQPQVEYFKKYFQVILIDLRGNGNSGKLDCPVASILDKQIEDIRGLLSFLKIKKATFIGVSYGGVLIQKLAITYPEIVKALIISDSFCDTSINSLQKLFAMIGAKQTWILHLPNKWLAKLTKSSYKGWPLASKEMENIMLNMRTYETKIQRKAINQIQFNGDLTSLNIPTLCLVGNYTSLGVQMMRQVASYIPNSEIEIIDNSFDPSNLCQPEEFNKRVHQFVSKMGF